MELIKDRLQEANIILDADAQTAAERLTTDHIEIKLKEILYFLASR